MKTSSFYEYQGSAGISIARYQPRGFRGLRVFSQLAPFPHMFHMPRPDYERAYLELLAVLDPAEVWRALHEVLAPAEPVLLCYEHPLRLADGSLFCHRRMVAAWFRLHLDFEVEEIVPRSLTRTGVRHWNAAATHNLTNSFLHVPFPTDSDRTSFNADEKTIVEGRVG